MNARLGNRSNQYTDYAVSTMDGRIQNCPLCRQTNYNEIHILIICPALDNVRAHLRISPKQSLKQFIERYIRQTKMMNAVDQAKYFLGHNQKLTKFEYAKRGFILEGLVSSFFDIWKSKLNCPAFRQRYF